MADHTTFKPVGRKSNEKMASKADVVCTTLHVAFRKNVIKMNGLFEFGLQYSKGADFDPKYVSIRRYILETSPGTTTLQ